MSDQNDLRINIALEGLQRAKAALASVASSAKQVFGAVGNSARGVTSTLATLSKPVTLSIRGGAQLAGISAILGGVGAALATLQGREAVAAGASLEAVRLGLEQISKGSVEVRTKIGTINGTAVFAMRQVADNTAAAAAEMAFLRRTSRELGIELESSSRAYLGLAASTNGTKVEGQATRDVFLGIVQAGRALGRTNEEVEGALLAVSQIAGKGVVSMEELRGQLGERIPGAVNIAARALGVTTAELNKIVASGELLSEDFLPKFAKQLQKEFGDAAKKAAETPQAAFARLPNSIFEARAAIANGGLSAALGRLATQAEKLVTAFIETGRAAQFGARLGAFIDTLPARFAVAVNTIRQARAEVEAFIARMRSAIGSDLPSVGELAAAGINKAIGFFRMLAAEVPAFVASLRKAFTGVDNPDFDTSKYDAFTGKVAAEFEQISTGIKKASKDVSAASEAIIDVLTPILEALAILRTSINDTFGEGTFERLSVIASLLKITGAFGLLKAIAIPVLTGIGAAISGLAAAFSAPVLAVAAVVAAVAAAAFLIYTYWDEIALTAGEAWQSVKDSFDRAISGIVGTFGIVVDGLQAAWTGFKNFIGGIVDGIIGFWEGIGTRLDSFGDGIFAALRWPFDQAKKVIAGLLNFVSGSWSRLKALFGFGGDAAVTFEGGSDGGAAPGPRLPSGPMASAPAVTRPRASLQQAALSILNPSLAAFPDPAEAIRPAAAPGRPVVVNFPDGSSAELSGSSREVDVFVRGARAVKAGASGQSPRWDR